MDVKVETTSDIKVVSASDINFVTTLQTDYISTSLSTFDLVTETMLTDLSALFQPQLNKDTNISVSHMLIIDDVTENALLTAVCV